jgi:tryptophan halogenase
MTAPRPTRVVIAGGGTAGWIAAVALARQLGRLVEVTLVESEEIGTIGVGESTIPTARAFHDLLRIDQQAFMQASQASFKLGISFENWARPGDRYIHSFGAAPLRTWVAEFQHFWLEANARGEAAPIGAYYPEHEAALAQRFTLQGEPPLNYAFHLDAGLYAQFLRRIAETDGVTRREGKIAEVELDGETATSQRW